MDGRHARKTFHTQKYRQLSVLEKKLQAFPYRATYAIRARKKSISRHMGDKCEREMPTTLR